MICYLSCPLNSRRRGSFVELAMPSHSPVEGNVITYKGVTPIERVAAVLTSQVSLLLVSAGRDQVD